jgi:hypothetical protein
MFFIKKFNSSIPDKVSTYWESLKVDKRGRFGIVQTDRSSVKRTLKLRGWDEYHPAPEPEVQDEEEVPHPLDGSVRAARKYIDEASIREIPELIEYEEMNKNRKSVIKYLQKRLG